MKLLIPIIKSTMNKIYYIVLLIVSSFSVFSQTNSLNEQLPVFPDCENTILEKQEACFYNTIQNFFFENFKVPVDLSDSDYKGNVVALFETDTLGRFRVIYVDALTEGLKKETKRIFELLPEVESATYSGRKTTTL